MLEFITAGDNLPFAVAIALMLLIALFEGIGALLGLALFSALDSLLPDLDIDADIEVVSGTPEAPGALSRVLGWLRLGQVPLLVLLVVFLTAFGLSGYAMQALASSIADVMLPGALASVVAILISLKAVNLSAAIWSRVLPGSESSGVSSNDFVGDLAVITIGTATFDKPAEAKLTDRTGQAHYVMVRPDAGQQPMPQGTEVLLVRKRGSEFVAIRHDSPVLSH
jgi:hypothetical protein